MAFSTWAALKTTLLDSMADGTWMQKSFEANGKKVEFRDFSDIKRFYDYVCRMADDEAGTAYGRTYARGGGLY